MKILKCDNGHYFDNDAYPSCPLCGASPSAKGNGEKKGFPLMGKKHEAAPPATPPAAPASPAAPAQAAAPTPPPAPPVETPAASAPPAPSVVPPAAPTPQDLKESIRQGSSLAEGKTLSYFSAMKQQAQEAAAPPQPEASAQPASNPVQTAQEAPLQPGSAISTPEDPAVGWLVCIGGAHLCETFPISVGLNSIGRGPGNKIVLGKDQSVSREKHAYLTFEPVKKHFFLRPGDSSGLTYLNDDYIYETKTIQAGDIIALGQSRFYFQPLCGENFSWDEYL